LTFQVLNTPQGDGFGTGWGKDNIACFELKNVGHRKMGVNCLVPKGGDGLSNHFPPF
jgi:hypothetical protein